MKKLVLLGILLAASSAFAFTGTPRPEWIGKAVSAAHLPHTAQPTVYVFAQTDSL